MLLVFLFSGSVRYADTPLVVSKENLSKTNLPLNFFECLILKPPESTEIWLRSDYSAVFLSM